MKKRSHKRKKPQTEQNKIPMLRKHFPSLRLAKTKRRDDTQFGGKV